MDEPKGSMEHLKLCMEGANKKVDPDGDDRKGGADDLGKIFFSASDDKLVIVAHVPKELNEKATLAEYMGAVCAPLGLTPKPLEGTMENADASDMMVAECTGDPDANRYPLKMRDVAIGAGFDFLRAKGLILDDDSGDDINFADECGVDLNAGAEGDY